MEEKERYEILEDSHIIYDFKHSNPLISLSSICDLLNQQDTRIKELEEALKKANTNNYLTDYYLVEKENQQLKEQLSLKMEELHTAYCGIENVKTKNGNLKYEIKQLKQSQKQLAIEKLEKVKQNVLKIDKTEIKTLENGYSTLYCDRPEVIAIIDRQIKQLKGE